MAERYHKPSIQDQGGLYSYLDLPEQRALHNGYGSQMWIEWHKLGLSTGAIAKLFNVSPATVRSWRREVI